MLSLIGAAMNPRQQAAMTALQIELMNQRNINTPLPDRGMSRQCAFTEVQGVTVCIGPDGGYILPAVRSWDPSLTALQAAVYADVRFQKNKPGGGPYKSGHQLGIVGLDWSCGGPTCECRDETDDQRFRRGVFIGRSSS
jgi:hypothetical protein